jgi:DNA-binding beta-propeller fold protein YncE
MKIKSSPVIGLLLLTLASTPALGGAEQDEPRYTRRLRLPTHGDRLSKPRAVHADRHTGEVFVCDTRANRIVIFDRDGIFLYEIRGGDAFTSPIDVAVDPDGYIVTVAIRGGVRDLILLDFDGRFLEEIQLAGLPEGSRLPDPVSVALSPTGDRLYTLDQANMRLWIASNTGTILDSIDLTEGLSEKEAWEQMLGHVDVYGERMLVTTSTTGLTALHDLDGSPWRIVGFKGTAPCQTAFPVAAALEPDGTLLILDNQRALFMRWDPEDNRCLGEYSGFGNVPGALYHPTDLALDGQGRIYVSQGFEGRVQVFETGRLLGGDAPE